MGEYKRASFKIEKENLTEADRLNGTTWRGYFSMDYTAFRTKAGKSSWSEWGLRHDKEAGPSPFVGVRKVNSSWLYSDITRYSPGYEKWDIFSSEWLKKPSCDEINQKEIIGEANKFQSQDQNEYVNYQNEYANWKEEQLKAQQRIEAQLRKNRDATLMRLRQERGQ